MLKLLRKKMRAVLWVTIIIVVPTFMAFYGYSRKGTRREKPAGVLYGKRVPIGDLQNAYSQEVVIARLRYGERFQQFSRRLNLEEQAWNRLIMRKETSRMGIEVSDQEVAATLGSIQRFQKDGKLDPTTYVNAVTQELETSPAFFEMALRETLAAGKLARIVGATAKASEREVRDEFMSRNEKVKAKAILFNEQEFAKDIKLTDKDLEDYFNAHRSEPELKRPAMVNVEYVRVNPAEFEAAINPTDEEITAYYDENLETRYKHPAEVKVAHVFLSKKPVEEKPAEKPAAEEKQKEPSPDVAKETAEKVLKLAKEGKDFAGLAKEYSEDTSTKEKGGLLDFFSRSQWGPEFDKAALELKKKGELSGPVETPYGYHVIKLEDRKEETVDKPEKVRDEIVKTLKTEEATSRALDQLDEFLTGLEEGADWKDLAGKKKLEIHETGLFAMGQEIPGIGEAGPVAQASFALEAVGEFSDTLKAPSGCYVLRLKEKQPERAPEKVEEVRKAVEARVQSEKARQKIREQAEACLSALRKGTAMKEAAAKFSGKFVEPEPLGRQGYLPEIGPVGELARSALRLKPGEFSTPVESPGAMAIVQLVERIPPDESKFPQEKDDIRRSLIAQKQSALVSQWQEEVKKKAGLVNYLEQGS